MNFWVNTHSTLLLQTRNINNNFEIVNHSDFGFQCNMIVFILPLILCFLSKVTFVTTLKLKSGELWLVKSKNNEYLVNINSTPTQPETWFLLTKQSNIGSDDILTLDEEGNLKTSSTTDDTAKL